MQDAIESGSYPQSLVMDGGRTEDSASEAAADSGIASTPSASFLVSPQTFEVLRDMLSSVVIVGSYCEVMIRDLKQTDVGHGRMIACILYTSPHKWEREQINRNVWLTVAA